MLILLIKGFKGLREPFEVFIIGKEVLFFKGFLSLVHQCGNGDRNRETSTENKKSISPILR